MGAREPLRAGFRPTARAAAQLNPVSWALALLLGLVAVAALTACSSDDPNPSSGDQPQPITAAAEERESAEHRTRQRGAAGSATDDEQTDSTAGGALQPADEEPPQASTADRQQDAEAAGSTLSDLRIDGGATWRDVYELLTAAEQACIRDRFGGETQSVLMRKILDDDEVQPWLVELFLCFSPETGRELLLLTALVGMSDEGLELGDEATGCLREVLADVDPHAIIAAAQVDGPELFEFLGEVWRCLPELMVDSIAGELGLDVDAVSDPELACLREWSRGLDAVALLEAMDAGDEATLVELSFGVFRCSPALLLNSFGDLGTELDVEAEACLGRLLEESEASDLVDEGSPEYERFYAELRGCLPALAEDAGAMSAASAGSDAQGRLDDHGDFIDEATTIAVGVEVSGEVGFEGDFDYFVFEAEQGVLYEISIGLVTLGDSALALYDAEWSELAFNDDHAETLASRLFWPAEYSGLHYIEIWGYDLGTYTVLVEAR